MFEEKQFFERASVPYPESILSASLGIRLGDPEEEIGDDIAEQESEPELAEPPLYKVILLNDDYTPMEFVVEVLQKFFGMDREKAVQIMLAVHTQGRATCGIFTRDVAETKAHLVNEYARESQQPLLCDIDRVE